MELLPPGGCRTLDDGLPVIKFPEFILDPDAKALLEIFANGLLSKMGFVSFLSNALFDFSFKTLEVTTIGLLLVVS